MAGARETIEAVAVALVSSGRVVPALEMDRATGVVRSGGALCRPRRSAR
ncbi:MAG: hypothetical protein ACP5P1_09140 [Acidimicrobiales bacterium]